MLWLVDPERRMVETWTPEATMPVVESDRLTWQPDGASGPLVLELDSILG